MRLLIFSLLLCAVMLLGQTAPQADLDIRTYNFIRTAGQSNNSAAGDLGFAGAGKVITLKPCPYGMVAVPYTGAGYYVYIDGGSGAGEAALVTQVSGTGGSQTCTITVTTVNAHSGSYRVSSATAGIQEAVNVRPATEAVTIVMPPLSQPSDQYYKLHGPVYVPTLSRTNSGLKKLIFSGSNTYGTRFLVTLGFPTSATGVFIIEPCDGCMAATLERFTVDMQQPSGCASNIGSCHPYPPLVMANGTFGLELKDLLIRDAWKIVSMKGTWTGSAWNPRVGWLKVIDVRASAYNVGFDLDGIVDTTQFVRMHYFPYGIGGGPSSPFYANNQFAIKVGRADGFQVDHSLFINKRAIQFNLGADGGSTFGSVTASQFDTYANIEVNAGEIQIANSYSTMATDCDAPAIKYASGRLMVSNHWFLNAGCNQNFIFMNTAGGGGTVTVNGGTMNHLDGSPATVAPSVYSHYVSGSSVNLIVSGVNVYRNPNLAWTNPVFSCDTAGNPCSFTGNSITPMATGSGVFISTPVDSWNTVRNNTFIGWGATFPAVKNVGKYEDGSTVWDLYYNGPNNCTGQSAGKVWVDLADNRTLKACP